MTREKSVSISLIVLMTAAAVYLWGSPLSAFAAEEKASGKEQKTESKQEKVEAKAEKAAPKEEAKAAAPVASMLKSEEAPLPEKKIGIKSISGTVSASGPRGIAVVYGKDKNTDAEMEIYLPFEMDTELTGYNSKEDITEGDIVTLTFGETMDKNERVLKAVRLNRKNIPEPVVEEASGEVNEKGNMKGE